MKESHPRALFGYICLVSCVFVTATYTFRMLFMAFHGQSRFDACTRRTSRPRW
jgi:NADH-quinone oxidoreductase subunit L